jgi:hypothetical protein
MLIDWPKFAAALVLLLTPVALFHGKSVRYRAISRDWEGYWGRTFLLWLHPFDFVRAAAGAWLLLTAMKLAPGTGGVVAYGPWMIQSVVLWSATSIQALVCKEPNSAHAPFAFVTGLVAVLVPPIVAGLAFILAVVCATGAHSPAIYFPLLAVCVPAIGSFLTGTKRFYMLAIVAVTLFLPFLLTWMFPRHFVHSYLGRNPDSPRRPA